ncbi:MAG: DNA recombination protein RmuC, partial [Burkholderiales bacterium]|nr:DNA recombination protein RmuC [Burkholderiales bacterium]
MSVPILLLLLLVLVVLVLQVMLWLRANKAAPNDSLVPLQMALQQLQSAQLDTERQLRQQLENTSLASRQELGANFSLFQQGLATQISQLATVQNAQLEQFGRQLATLAQANAQQLTSMRDSSVLQAKAARDEQAQSLSRFADSVNQTLQATLQNLTDANNQRFAEVRQTLETRLRDLQNENGLRLEEMRKTVDEKLHATLEQRLGESFKQVSERLEKVHQGLGEMQQLAVGVGDLKRVLTNVKSRGTWGEVQLAILLEQVLTPEQYGVNVETVPNSGARVEFAVKLPGKDDKPVWLPIDAKFPKEQYERMMDAIEQANAEALALASKELERAIRLEAKTIA